MSSPPDERDGAPAQERPAADDSAHPANGDSVAFIVNCDGAGRQTPTSRDVLLAEIYALGPDALLAASLGWRLGRLDAEEIVKQRISDAGRDVASSPEWRATVRRPMQSELVQRRRAPRNCACGRCSACVYLESLRRRGGRPFLGVRVERGRCRRTA